MVSREEKKKAKIAIKLAKRDEALRHLEDIKLKEKIGEIKMLLTDESLKLLKDLKDQEQQDLYNLLLDLCLPVIANLRFVRQREIERAKFTQKVWSF